MLTLNEPMVSNKHTIYFLFNLTGHIRNGHFYVILCVAHTLTHTRTYMNIYTVHFAIAVVCVTHAHITTHSQPDDC